MHGGDAAAFDRLTCDSVRALHLQQLRAGAETHRHPQWTVTGRGAGSRQNGDR